MTFRYHLKKRKPSCKAILKKQIILWINHKILLKHRTFLHRYRNYLNGHGNEFDEEPLHTQAMQQRTALDQSINRGG